MPPTRPSLLFLASSLLLPLINAATGSSCSYFGGLPCLPNVDGSGSGSFAFKPLFPSDVKLVVAFDAMNQSEADKQPINVSGVDPGPYNKIGGWLEYSSDKLDASSNMITDMLLFVLNATSFKGAPGGGNNGCDGVWGAACSKEIRTKLPGAIASKAGASGTGTDRFLERAVTLVDFSEGSTACVPDMWGGGYGLGIGEALTLSDLTAGINQDVATETSSATPKIISSGSQSKNWFTAVTAKSQPDAFLDVIWVGVIARAPSTVLGTTTTAADKVQVEFVCVKAEKGDAGLKGSGGSSSSSTGAASTPTGAAVAGVQMAGPLLLGVAGLAALGMF